MLSKKTKEKKNKDKKQYKKQNTTATFFTFLGKTKALL